MRIRNLSIALAVMAGLLLSAPTAHAKRPLNVDCDVLESAIIAADAILDANLVVFDSVGDLFSSAIVDPAVFQLLSDLIEFTSVGAILFDSASQAISTVASCGLLPLLNREIGD